jgi:hypothetical protein
MADALLYRDMKLLELKPSPFGDLLVAPGDHHFGATQPPSDEIQVNGLNVRLSDRPLPKNLCKLYAKSHAALAAELAVFDTYDLWLIPHSVGVLRKFGSAQVTALGYEADFHDAEQVYTLDMLPQTRFTTIIGGSIRLEADLGLEGHAELPEPARKLLDSLESLGGDARLKFSSDAKLLGRISFSLLSPAIQSVGVGKHRIVWQLDLDSQPLLGDQILLQTVAVPAGTKQLQFQAKAYALIKSHAFSFPAMFETTLVDIFCPLAA